MQIYSASDFARLNIDIEWAVETLVPAYGINFVYAEPKVGKSIFSCQLAHSLGTLSPFLDRPARGVLASEDEGQTVITQNGSKEQRRPWRVLYVQADEPMQEWSAQLRQLGEEVQEGWDTVHFGPGAFKDPTVYREVQSGAKDYDYVILDSLISLYGELNHAKDATIALDSITKLFDGPTLVIHHKRKPAPGIPDVGVSAMAFSFALSARGSALYDLRKSRLEARGRIVKADINLKRTASGLWVVDHEAGEFD